MNEHSSHLITLRTLAMARWVMIAIMAALGLVLAGLVPGFESPGLHLLHGTAAVLAWYAVIATWSILNFVATHVMVGMSKSTRWAGGMLVVDALFLSGLFALSGGAANPFTVLYFVPITLATQVSPRWTWGVAFACLSSFGLLFVVSPQTAEPHGMHFSGHLKGMWFAFAVSGAVLTVFVHRIAVAIASARQELFDLRESALRDRQLAQVGSLAAGAAHELGTPLATMTVLLGEFAEMDPVEQEQAIDSVRAELYRCKHIIQSMASSELRVDQLSSDAVEPWPPGEVVEDITDELEVVSTSPAAMRVRAPRPAVVEILRELIANSVKSGTSSAVKLFIGADGDFVNFTVEDDGPGMSEEVAAKATDPFFTTRGADRHMGLGLFIARSQAHHLGGSLEVDTDLGKGTRVTLKVPSVSGSQP